ncbi:hypothetical protein JI721_05690 [Alicyclobacillus cycloheptanicus]|uniref:YkoP-like domain-containing protein n=1 Tax=Alicyclobacillus cycloheptanicus TaxID=1457 RepID=A0ABT9XGK9_9BACL|nr:hypothetical protein [Alicyclobacillus cycloheptanicus]MDQ0189432.1 hypothetical protein [Alicyclobacillus cycloheptanicus]WDM02302.1 hypothetical protein JI721_05690 [Alicyclobacillus cycloheptanicus]
MPLRDGANHGANLDVPARTQWNPRDLFNAYPLWRRGLIFCWQPVEALFTRLYHVTDVNDMFRISPAVWHHGERLNKDGITVLYDGAPVLDLHFQNLTLLQLSNAKDNRALIRGLRDAKRGLTDVAALLRDDERYRDVRALTAFTLIHRGIDLLGFHVEPLPDTSEKRRLQAYMRFLMGMYHPEGFRRLREGRQSLEVKLVWMSREELMAAYGTNNPALR